MILMKHKGRSDQSRRQDVTAETLTSGDAYVADTLQEQMFPCTNKPQKLSLTFGVHIEIPFGTSINLEFRLRTSLARCSALQLVPQQGARDVDLLGLCHRGVGHGRLCGRHDVERRCGHRDVDLCLRVACAQAQRIPLASRGEPCGKVSSCLS